jgi:hypothetical protein
MIDRSLNSARFLHAHLPYGIVPTIDPSAIGSVPNDSDSKYQNPTEGILFLPFYVFGTFSPFHLQMQLTLPIFARVLRDSDSSTQISIWLRLVFSKFTYVFRNSMLTAGFLLPGAVFRLADVFQSNQGMSSRLTFEAFCSCGLCVSQQQGSVRVVVRHDATNYQRDFLTSP